MTARRFLALGAASCAVAAASPALAQPEMTYEQRTYEYAQPQPANGAVIYRQQPVVQPIPAPIPTTSQPVVQPIPAHHAEHGTDYEVEYEVNEGPASTHTFHHGPVVHHAIPHHAMPHGAVPTVHHGSYYPYPHHGARPPMPNDFDREAWLEDCRDGYRNPRRRNSGAVGGGLLGAAVGGVIGNRVADGDRLAGTLIGAGVGGLAGLAIGSAIASSGDRRRAREACEAWLDDYMSGRHRGWGWHHGSYGYGWGYGYTMTYVPVLITVPQRAIIRETVTEEWVTEKSHTHHHYKPAKKKRVIYRKAAPAPKPAKRVKYSKGK